MVRNRLREARRAAGLSVDAMVRLSGLSRTTIVDIEAGEKNPSYKTMWALARALGKPVDWLFPPPDEEEVNPHGPHAGGRANSATPSGEVPTDDTGSS